MSFVVIGALALVFFLLAGWLFTSIDAHRLANLLRYGLGALLLGTGGLFALARQWGVGMLLIAVGLSAISIGRIGPIDLGGGRRTAGSVSTVRSAYLEMRLDHDSGAMVGRVIAGEFAGTALDDLDEAALLRLAAEVGDDADSAALLEGYLDRRMPGWREHVDRDGATGAGSAADASPMTDEQAYEVLGLSPGASEAEIRAAHRRLMKRVHPDQGGSTFLAAKINQAKDWLLSRHR